MSTITALGLVLMILMILVGGKQGWTSFLSLLLNFGFLYFAIVLIAFHVPRFFEPLTTETFFLALTFFWGEYQKKTTVTAFYASLIVMGILLLLIIGVEHWAMVQGFGPEDSEDLEGMSILIGISYLKVAVTTTILSTLGAIAEAAMAVAAGLTEVLNAHPDISTAQIMKSGMAIGGQIIGTTFNTLFFGFFGGFLTLFIWFAGLHYSFGTIMNNKIFVAEMIMVLTSFIGVLLTVPITAWIMGLRKKTIVDSFSENK
ncbi:MAG: YibE/F family protein [Limosilactobacillus mucosae]|nr:YibE/F family protein [Limosilactobacillus mucosae]